MTPEVQPVITNELPQAQRAYKFTPEESNILETAKAVSDAVPGLISPQGTVAPTHGPLQAVSNPSPVTSTQPKNLIDAAQNVATAMNNLQNTFAENSQEADSASVPPNHPQE